MLIWIYTKEVSKKNFEGIKLIRFVNFFKFKQVNSPHTRLSRMFHNLPACTAKDSSYSIFVDSKAIFENKGIFILIQPFDG